MATHLVVLYNFTAHINSIRSLSLLLHVSRLYTFTVFNNQFGYCLLCGNVGRLTLLHCLQYSKSANRFDVDVMKLVRLACGLGFDVTELGLKCLLLGLHFVDRFRLGLGLTRWTRPTPSSAATRTATTAATLLAEATGAAKKNSGATLPETTLPPGAKLLRPTTTTTTASACLSVCLSVCQLACKKRK
jgi:hypothetical protein